MVRFAFTTDSESTRSAYADPFQFLLKLRAVPQPPRVRRCTIFRQAFEIDIQFV